MLTRRPPRFLLRAGRALSCAAVLGAFAWMATAAEPSSVTDVTKVEFSARDFEGKPHAAAEMEAKASVWLWLSPDCPISNAYAPEIARLTAEYTARGVRLNFVYSEPDLDNAALAAHARAYGLRSSLFRDDDGRLARACGITITPEVAVIDAHGKLAYRGRIDDRFVALGRERSVVTTRDLRDALEAMLAGRPIATPRTPAIGCAMTLTH